MFAYIPFWKQAHFTQQHGLVVQRQNIFLAGKLDFNQRVAGVAVELARIIRAENFQVSGVAEVAQQQKSLLQILRDDLRHVYAGLRKQIGDADEGATVLMLRGGVHNHQRAIGEGGAEITAETGVGRCGRECEWLVWVEAGKPVIKLLLTFHRLPYSRICEILAS